MIFPDIYDKPFLPGGQLETNNAGWRVSKPQIDLSLCNKCWLCWLYCPDGAIRREAGGPVVDGLYCKGCGICAVECKKKAITMVKDWV